MSAAYEVEAQTGKRRSRGGRKPNGDHLRCERVTITAYESDVDDLELLSKHWDVSMSTLCWAVIHDWLQMQRPSWAELGEVRGRLRSAVELGLRDKELGPWLRGLISEVEHGS